MLKKQHTNPNSLQSPPPVTITTPSLLTLTSITVSKTFSFQQIEDRYKNIIPEPVQKSIIFHSFPKHESQVLVYASSDFNEARYRVGDVVQIGFHVSGVVFEVVNTTTSKRTSRSNSNSSRSNHHDDDFVTHGLSSNKVSYKVSASFDRGKITSVCCNCENEKSLIFWCDHVIALALYRIRRCVVGVDFVLRVPISETLLQLNRSQLQKLVQYLISDHTEVLPTAQKLADEILFMKTDDNFINRIHGAPDPTAGPSITDPHSWALNTPQLKSKLRSFLSSPQQLPTTSPNFILQLIEKIYKMIQSKDSNAERILQIITNELVRHSSSPSPTPKHHSNRSNTISNAIWDQIVRIWNVIVLKPGITNTEVNELEKILTNLCNNDNLPESEDPEEPPKKRQKLNNNSIFSTPLNLLKKRANKPDYEILSLHSKVCHGYQDNEHALKILNNLRRSGTIKLENAHLLFNVLKQNHAREAYESALIGLTTQSILKQTNYIHEKHLKLVEKLLSKIASLPSQHPEILKQYVKKLLSNESNTFPLISFATYAFQTLNGSELAYKLALSNLNISESNQNFITSHLESQQITLATLLLTSSKDNFQKLEQITNTLTAAIKSQTNLFRLAQEVFKHANNENLTSISFNIAIHVVKATKYPTPNASRRRADMVKWVVSCALEIGVSKLFYLVRNWGEYFCPIEAMGCLSSSILGWLGCSTANITITGGNTGVAIVPTLPPQPCSERGCGGGGGREVVSSKLVNVDLRILEELGGAARKLAIQCGKNDPGGCALNSLTLCETDPMSFEASYAAVIESASKEFLSPPQIYTIARYMEHRGYTQRAYRLALIALQHIHVGYNQDNHPMGTDITWTLTIATQLSTPPIHHHHQQSRFSQQPSSSKSSYYKISSLQPPTSELENLIPLLLRNVKNSLLLTDLLKRTINTITSYENYQKSSDNTSQQRSLNKKLKQRVYDKLSILIEGTIDTYVSTAHSRLLHISPRHYGEFVVFLGNAHEVFLLAPNGGERFKQVVESMKVSYKGKKKLLLLLSQRFGSGG